MSSRAGRRPYYDVLMTCATLVISGLRLSGLLLRSFWQDENYTLLRINGSWSDLFANIVLRQETPTLDIVPPLYFALLKLWALGAGVSVFALRAMPAFFGVLLVPLVYVTGRRIGGRAIGRVAAALAALTGVYQWFAAELRMYTLMACLGALALYFLYGAIQPANRGRVAAVALWTLTLVAGVYSHYSFIALALAHVFVLIVVLARDARMRPGLRALALSAMIVISGAVVAPLIAGPTLARIYGLVNTALTHPNGASMSPLALGYEMFGALLFGFNAADPTGGLILLAAFALCVFGLPGSRRSALALGATIVVPLCFWLTLSFLIENRPSFRYMLYAFPALHVLMARGLIRLWGRKPRALAAAASMLMAGSLTHGMVMTFVPTPTFQDDWRGFGAALRARWQQGDLVIINFDTPESVLPYVAGEAVRDLTVVDHWLRLPRDQARASLDAAGVIWYANTGGDAAWQNVLMRPLLAPYRLKQRLTFAGRTNIIELLGFETTDRLMTQLPEGVIAVPAPASGVTSIAGYALRPASGDPMLSNVVLDVFWRRGNDDPARHALGLSLVDAADGGAKVLDWVAQAGLDAVPAAWQAGQLYSQRYVVPVPPGLGPRAYQLQIQVRAGEKGEVAQRVSEPATEQWTQCCLRIKHWPGARWTAGDVTLAQAEYPATVHPGDALPVALIWRAGADDTPGWQNEIAIEAWPWGRAGADSRAVSTADWRSGEVYRTQQSLAVPDRLATGWYRLALNRARDQQHLDGVTLGWIHVIPHPHTTVTADPPIHVSASAGDFTLLGYGGPAQFERAHTYTVITYWQVDRAPVRDGRLFVHVIGPDGKPVAQDDNAPMDGTRSSLSLSPGDGIDQHHTFVLKSDLPPGEYAMYAGVYDAAGGERWPAQQDGRPARDNLIRLGAFTLR